MTELHLHFHLALGANALRPLVTLLEKLLMDTTAIKASLAASETKIDALTTTLGKVATETAASLTELQTLRDIIAGMQNPDPELVAVVDRIATKVQAAADAAAGIDAQVPDEPPAPAVAG